MRLPRPSLVRRLTLAFVLGQGLATLLLLLAIFPFALAEDDEPVGPDVVHAAVSRELIRDATGKLVIKGEGSLEYVVRNHPTTWFVARIGQQSLSFGAVPGKLLPALAKFPGELRDARFRNLGRRGPAGDASIDEIDTPAGTAIVAAGGVASNSIDFTTYLMVMRFHDFFWAPFVTGLLTVFGVLFAIPIVLRSIRPSAKAAAELDPADLSKRLPEKGVVKQLLPLIRAFNAALDRVAEAFDRRRRFIADVAHELRTPLAILTMHVDKLPPRDPKPDLQRTLFRLGQMVGQMLDAERLTLAGRQHEDVNLVELARMSVAEVAPLAVSHGYDVGLVAARDEVIVRGDAHAISRALANLLGNAVAHGGGSGTIEVRVSANGIVDVADEGPGVPAEAKDRIFEPFHRERWDKDGCGLGLHLVREIMQAHGGKARLVGIGEGALFRLEFPTARPA